MDEPCYLLAGVLVDRLHQRLLTTAEAVDGYIERIGRRGSLNALYSAAFNRGREAAAVERALAHDESALCALIMGRRDVVGHRTTVGHRCRRRAHEKGGRTPSLTAGAAYKHCRRFRMSHRPPVPSRRTAPPRIPDSGSIRFHDE